MVTQPEVVLLQLEKQPFFEDQYADLIEDINLKASVREIQWKDDASDLFLGTDRPLVFATDEALSSSAYRKQRDEAVEFVRTGGTIVFGADFPSIARFLDFADLFGAFALPWSAESFHNMECELNPAVEGVDVSGLLQRYTLIKAMQLKGVKRSQALYLKVCDHDSDQECNTAELTSVNDFVKTPAAFGSFGKGRIGFTGDVNGEKGTDKAVMAMLGLS